MPTENKYEVNETIIRFYIVRAWSFGPRPVRQSCFTLDPPLGCDDNVVYAAEYHCIPLVFLICIACVIIKYATRRAAFSVNWPLMF